MALLHLDRLSFSYPNRFALREISLNVAEGAFIALIGPNGSGKTTLLRLMTGVLQPEKGQIYLQGRLLKDFSPRQLGQEVAVISSEQYFEFPFPVAHIVAMGRFPYLGRLKKMSRQDWEIVERSMSMTQTDQLRECPIDQLSSGERQRVLIARAVAQRPTLLMLDEPNAHLDIKHQIETFRLLQSLNREENLTVIMVLHDLTVAAAFCQSVVLLNEGRLVSQGTPQEVITTDIIREIYGADILIQRSPTANMPQVSYMPLPLDEKI